ncbi:MAG TPA: tetratricopeptide repeat protein [Bryobacteraceae bacterium]|nr:tetratricopeptide repeat protein [Bryobacteraceae bacterium]
MSVLHERVRIVYGGTTLNRLVLTIAMAGVLCSCTHQVQTLAPAGAHTSVATVMARQVQNATDAGEGDVEARTLRRQLAANPRDLNARILLARWYIRRGLPDLALEHERLAAAQFPDSSIAALELAKTLRQMAEPEQALAVIGNFLAKHPGESWELRSLEGILEDERGEFARAEEAHRAALAIDPQRSALHNNLGYNLMLQGRAEAAAAEFRKAIEIDPRSQIAHNNLGASLIAASAPAEALAEWQRASGPAAAHNNMAAVLIGQGRYEEAREELEQALKFRSDFPAAIANLRLVAEHDGKPSTIPAAAPVNFWKRVASTFGWFVAGTP